MGRSGASRPPRGESEAGSRERLARERVWVMGERGDVLGNGETSPPPSRSKRAKLSWSVRYCSSGICSVSPYSPRSTIPRLRAILPLLCRRLYPPPRYQQDAFSAKERASAGAARERATRYLSERCERDQRDTFEGAARESAARETSGTQRELRDNSESAARETTGKLPEGKRVSAAGHLRGHSETDTRDASKRAAGHLQYDSLRSANKVDLALMVKTWSGRVDRAAAIDGRPFPAAAFWDYVPETPTVPAPS